MPTSMKRPRMILACNAGACNSARGYGFIWSVCQKQAATEFHHGGTENFRHSRFEL